MSTIPDCPWSGVVGAILWGMQSSLSDVVEQVVTKYGMPVARYYRTGTILGGGHDWLRRRSTASNVSHIYTQRTICRVWSDDGLRASAVLPQRQSAGRGCRQHLDDAETVGEHTRHQGVSVLYSFILFFFSLPRAKVFESFVKVITRITIVLDKAVIQCKTKQLLGNLNFY